MLYMTGFVSSGILRRCTMLDTLSLTWVLWNIFSITMKYHNISSSMYGFWFIWVFIWVSACVHLKLHSKTCGFFLYVNISIKKTNSVFPQKTQTSDQNRTVEGSVFTETIHSFITLTRMCRIYNNFLILESGALSKSIRFYILH